MKTRQILFSLVVFIAMLLAACSPQMAPAESMPEKNVAPTQTAEIMMEEEEPIMEAEGDETMVEDEMKSGEDGEMMSPDDEMMSDDVEMTSDHDDQMMEDQDDAMVESDDEGEMGDPQDEDMMEDKDDDIAGDDDRMDDKDEDMADDDMMSDEEGQMSPDWFGTPLTDARTGETFTIADFKGKVVLVETLAMWCPKCFEQQLQVYTLHDMLGDRDDFVSLGIDIDPNENAEALKAYIRENGFTWFYTVAPPEVAHEIAQLYGDQFLNPPSTPMLIIDREGEVHRLPFGIKSAESLLEALQPFLDSEM